MNLKKSWVNVPLLKNTIKQNTLFAKVSLVVVCIFSIVGMINSSASFIAIITYSLSCVLLTTCYAGLVQKYMTSKTEAGFMASLPIDSFTLWFTQYVAGLVLVVGTLLIESICIAIMPLPTIYTDTSPLLLIMTTAFLSLFYYTVSYFVSCMAGNRLGQFIYTVMFYALPLLFYVGIEILARSLAPYGNGLGTNDVLSLGVPLVSGLEFLQGGTWSYFTGHIVIVLVFLVGGYFIFKYRNIENTGSALLNKKVNFFLKILVVIALTLSTYMIITQVIMIVPNYAIKNIFKAAVIFVLLGSLLGLLLEMLFHSQHMYKSLVYYVPTLLLCFLGCYIYGNYQYQELVNSLNKSREVKLIYYTYAYNEQENSVNRLDAIVSIDSKLAQQLVSAIERKDLLSSHTVSNLSNPMEMNFYFDDVDTRDLTIYASQDVMKDILAKNPEILQAVANSYYDLDTSELENVNAVFVSGNDYYYHGKDEEDLSNVKAILDATQIARLKEYIDTKQYMNIDTMFASTYTAMYPKGHFTLLNGDAFINNLIYDEKALERAYRFNQCMQIINGADSETVQIWKKTYPDIFTTSHFYIQNVGEIDSIKIMDDQTIAMDLMISLETEEYESAGIVKVKCTFSWQEGTMVLTNIEKVGDK